MKLNVKDLIQTGIFTVIYFITFVIAAMLGYIPVFVIILPAITGILGGIPFSLFVAKEQKFGAVTLMGLLSGILCTLMGQHWISILFGLVFGILADLIMKAGSYKKFVSNLIAYCVFTLWTIGSMLPMWILRDTFFESYKKKGGTEAYIEAVRKLTPLSMLPVIILLGIVGAVIGAYLGKLVLKKHFEKAGIV